MITPAFVQTMAHYNRWQNESLYQAASTLDDAARMQNRGAFFGSIQGTLSHLLWGDEMWMHRFADTPKPECGISDSATFHADWVHLNARRTAQDNAILTWAMALEPDWLAGELTWVSSAAKRELSRPRALLVAHMFNHQTHHRGQVHAMLTAAGARPDDTDLMLLD
jgi:uncharacterized damage-inducible protein DinB